MRACILAAVFVAGSTAGLLATDGEESYQSRCALCRGGDGAVSQDSRPNPVRQRPVARAMRW